MKIAVIFIFSSFISLVVVFFAQKFATHFRIGSLPSPRKLHKGFKPLLGGLGFFASILIAYLLAIVFNLLPTNSWIQNYHFWAGLLVVVVLGLWDDIKGISSRIKFIGQGVAAAFLVLGGCQIQSLSGPLGDILNLGIFAIPFTFLWIIFIINAINLLDGLDGLAGGICFIITIGVIIISSKMNNPFLIILGIGLAGGLLGFLRYNYHPARIFMGEVGSLQLGYIMAFFSIETLKVAATHQVYFLASLIIFAIPLIDTLVSFLRRLNKGQNPFSADKEHIHHRLLGLGLNHLQTVWMLYLFTALYVVLGVLMTFFVGFMGLILFIFGFLFAIFWIWRLGYFETRASWQNLANQFQKGISAQKRAPLFFNKVWHILLLFLSDLISLNLALFMVFILKFQSGLIVSPVSRPITEYFNSPAFLLLTFAWVLLFYLNNLYFLGWDISRFEKFWRVTKVITFGIIILSLLTLDTDRLMTQSQMMSLILYWFFTVLFVNAGRLIIINIEKSFKIFEYLPKKTIIIGCNEVGRKILEDININPHLIFNVIGFVAQKKEKSHFYGLPILGEYSDLPKLIHKYKIEEVIIALSETASDDFINILSLCEPQQVKIKIPPGTQELYTAKQANLVSHSYVQLFVEKMVLWQWLLKRIFDLVTGLISVILLLPFLIFVSLYIKLQLKKSIIVKIPVLGKNGIPFQLLAFRLTDEDFSYHNNPIYLGTGSPQKPLPRFLNLLYIKRLYKLPQLFNVILGDMSIIGPRPEPPEWFEEFSKTIKFLYRRIMVRPGLTGLAQVKYHYELSQKILQEWVKYDIYYIENMSIRMDWGLLLRSLLLILRRQNRGNT